MPFLIPMLLQLTFGMTAAASGGITLATALGAFAMKGVARKALKVHGFRSTLTVIGIASPLCYALIGLVNRDWPMPTIFALLMGCGFLVSLQFTAYNAIAYADVPSQDMSRATSFYATFQQLSLSLGVCAGASALGLAMHAHAHRQPGFDDFAVAIWTVTAISMLAVLSNMAFARDAGSELSGHGMPAADDLEKA